MASHGKSESRPGIERRGSVPVLDNAHPDPGAPHLMPSSLASLDENTEAPVVRPQLGGLPKSKSWASRVSALIPSLMSPPPEVPQKPVTRMAPTAQQTPPPPPYDAHDADDAPAPFEPPAGAHGSALDNTKLVDSKRNTLTKRQPPRSSSSQRSSFSQDVAYLADAGYLSDNPLSSSPGRLKKEARDTDHRKGSASPTRGGYPESAPKPRLSTPTEETRDARGRSVSAQVPGAARPESRGTRVTSSPVHHVTGSTAGSAGQSPSRGRLRRSWLPGGRSRSNSVEPSSKGGSKSQSYAWVLTDNSYAEYNYSYLANGEKVPELWNEAGTILVYLYPQGSGHGPSFKVPEFTISSSLVLSELIRAEQESSTTRDRSRSFDGRDSLSIGDASRRASPPADPDAGEMRLYVPVMAPTVGHQEDSSGDLERMIAVRNMFAFLTGQPLVGTKARPTVFTIFMQLADLLQEFCFTNEDGTTFGDAVDMSFGFFSDQLNLGDCRGSREKTVESLILGERMRSSDLYSEAFAHAAGKYLAIMELQLPVMEKVSAHTRQQLERAHFDLVNRQHNVNSQLENFEFPSLFAGIANSTSYTELRAVRFKVWRNSYNKMRSFVLAYYKSSFGSWPPKASSKKNPFAESGLNRLVLKMLYSDMCALYDLTVDRQNRTSRVIDEVPKISDAADEMIMSALRNMLSENDRSRPPVLPPIPYDVPQLPSMTSVMANYHSLSAKEQAKADKRVKEHEVMLMLNKAYNYDTNSIKLPFLDAFKDFELKEAKGKTAHDMADQRIGYWLFLYVVIQSLPMLVVDAPGLKFTEGTEYFLCEPPMGNFPWDEDKQVRKAWYNVAGGTGMVELSADTILFSTEATYNRSHCWLAAKAWEGDEGGDAMPPQEPPMSPLQPPPSVLLGNGDSMGPSPPPLTGTPPGSTESPPLQLRTRNLSAGNNRASHVHRSSMLMGLEPVGGLEQPPLSAGSNRASMIRPSSSAGHFGSRSPSATNLLAGVGQHPNRMSMMPHSAANSSATANTGATFDDILATPQEEKKPAPKKKGRFF